MGWRFAKPCTVDGTRLSAIHGLFRIPHAEPHEPGIASVRYEELAGAPAQRVEWFRALFHFGKTVDEWERLPWWQPKMYMDELAKHLRREAGVEDPQDTPVDGDISDMSDLGIAVEKVQ